MSERMAGTPEVEGNEFSPRASRRNTDLPKA